jgi:hypothetical protein
MPPPHEIAERPSSHGPTGSQRRERRRVVIGVTVSSPWRDTEIVGQQQIDQGFGELVASLREFSVGKTQSSDRGSLPTESPQCDIGFAYANRRECVC